MSARTRAAAVVRWVRDPRAAIVTGVILMVGAAVAIAVTWPPSSTSLRPFVAGILLVLRGVALILICRLLAGRRRDDRPVQSGPTGSSSAAPARPRRRTSMRTNVDTSALVGHVRVSEPLPGKGSR